MTDRPPVVVYSTDLMDRSRISAVIADAAFVRDVESLLAAPARRVLVDLGRPDALGAVAALAAGSGVPIIGFGAHVDDDLLAAAGAAGCTEVLPRSRFFRRLADFAD